MPAAAPVARCRRYGRLGPTRASAVAGPSTHWWGEQTRPYADLDRWLPAPDLDPVLTDRLGLPSRSDG